MRSGFVTILGKPNSGKSTLLNALVGEEIAIATSKPQTTRARIQGIVQVPGAKGRHTAAEIIFVDTPGVHRGRSQLDRRMMREVAQALEQRDLVLLLVDATRPLNTGDDGSTLLLSLIGKLECPVFLVPNKIDLIRKDSLLPLIASLSALHRFAEVIPISARKRDGLDLLVRKLVEHLPERPRYFPPDQFTDQPERVLVAEFIREQILLVTGEEVPYASAVVIEKFEEPQPGPRPGVTRIWATIYCERSGQKAILIGKGGSKLKSIGTAARKKIESLLGTRVYLDLRVAVEENWREATGFLDALDWRRNIE